MPAAAEHDSVAPKFAHLKPKEFPMNLALTRGAGVAIGRVILGVIFVAHGWQKFHDFKIDGVKANFEMMDVPLPTLSAYFATYAELIGGVLLIVGVAIPVVALVLVVDMLGALFTAHIDSGFWVGQGGYEFVLALIAGLVAVGFAAPGKLSVDGQFIKE